MKKLKLIFPIALLMSIAMWSCQKPATQEAASSDPVPNALTDEEKAAGWELLFDGATLDGWKRYNHDTIGPLWTVKEGMIVCDGTALGEGSKDPGSLTTIKTFGNFDLSVEWKITPGGNSGILYHVVESPEYKTDYATGPEYQVMDDAGWKGDSLNAAQKVGSNYDMFEAPATKKVLPPGEWNTSRIVYNNGHVEHYLNGEKTVEFDEGSEEYNKRYQQSKWVGFPGWNKSKTGAISLQEHGAPVYYRSIKIKAL